MAAHGVTNMFLIISWILGGAVIGGISVPGMASAISTFPRGDIGTAVTWLLIGVALGAAGGGIIGRIIRQKFAGNPRKLNLLTGVPWLAALVLVGGHQHIRTRLSRAGAIRILCCQTATRCG
jgi:MFS family permease